jgi:hypothetical protein
VNCHFVSHQWFPPYLQPLHADILGPCLHCGQKAGIAERDYPDNISHQDAFAVSVWCSSCGFRVDFSDGQLPGYPATYDTRTRARTMVATLWNGRNARPPLLSFHEWQAGTVFTGGEPPEWNTEDQRQNL